MTETKTYGTPITQLDDKCESVFLYFFKINTVFIGEYVFIGRKTALLAYSGASPERSYTQFSLSRFQEMTSPSAKNRPSSLVAASWLSEP